MALKVGLVGMGGIGGLHADAYAADPLGELAAVCDMQLDKAQAAAEKYGARAYGSLEEMLVHEELDIVDVTTGGHESGGGHFEPTMQGLEAGKHVLVEKPLSNDIEQCRQMVRRAAELNLGLGCNLNHIFTTAASLAQGLIADGKVGEPVYALMKAGFDGGELVYGGRDAAKANLPYTHFKAFLTHPFSVMRHFCGEIVAVQCFAGQPGFRSRCDDPMLSVNSVHVRFANGSIGYLLSQRGDARYGLGGWWSFEMAGSLGTFCIENVVEKVTYWEAPTPSGKAEPVVMETGVARFEQTFPDRIHAFLEDVSSGSVIRGSGRDALATMECVFAAIESHESGGAVVAVRA